MIKQAILALVLIISGAIGLNLVTAPAAQAACPSGRILTIPPWYDGLTDAYTCKIKSPASNPDAQRNFIIRIALNIVDMLFQLSGYVTTGFIIYGGFLFMTSTGDSSQAARGRKTLINAIVGLVVVIGAVAIVNVVKGAFKI